MKTEGRGVVLGRRGLALVGAVGLLLLTSCYGLQPRSGSGTGTGVAMITDVRSANNGNFDRVVFEFGAGALPAWDVRLATPPFIQDGSGATVPVSGHAHLAVRLSPADAHSFYSGPRRFSPPGTPDVTEVVNTGDFEAVVNWVIGLENLRDFRVQVLDSPKRLVIDIEH